MAESSTTREITRQQRVLPGYEGQRVQEVRQLQKALWSTTSTVNNQHVSSPPFLTVQATTLPIAIT